MKELTKKTWATAELLAKQASCLLGLIEQACIRPAFASSFLIPSHLTYQERMTLFRLAQRAGVIAEIGSYIGASACCFGAAIKAAGHGKVVCIDTWQNDAMTEGSRDTWQDFHANTRRFSDLIVPVRGNSTVVVQTVREIAPRLDVLFIDGDHAYAGVKADWESYKAFLKAGALVIFHDYGWAEGVRRVVQEDVMPLVRRHDSLPNMWWGQIGGVR